MVIFKNFSFNKMESLTIKMIHLKGPRKLQILMLATDKLLCKANNKSGYQ